MANRELKAGDRGRILVQGDFIDGSIREVMRDGSLSFQSDQGVRYGVSQRNFVPTPAADVTEAAKPDSNQSRHDWIERNAYYRYLNEGGLHGNHLRHWSEAETEYESIEQHPSSKSPPA